MGGTYHNYPVLHYSESSRYLVVVVEKIFGLSLSKTVGLSLYFNKQKLGDEK